MNCSLLVSSVHEISQAKILEWVAISFSRASSQNQEIKHVSLAFTGGFFTAEPTGKPLNFSFIDMFKDFANTTHKIKMDFYFYCSGIFVFLKIGSISFWFSEVLPMVNP